MMSRQKLDVYRGRDPREIPAYGLVEAAHYLRLPDQTLHRWLYGYRLPNGRLAKPVVTPADPETHQLSFLNLVELYVLSGLRRDHQIKLPKIREALDELAVKFDCPHPLVDREMLTDGVSLFVEELGELVNLNKSGQRAMREILWAYLKRIDRDASGLAIRLFPFTRTHPKPDAPRLVSIDPRVAFGRPVIAGTRIPTVEIFERYRAGDSIDVLLQEYDASPDQIHEAIRYEIAA